MDLYDIGEHAVFVTLVGYPIMILLVYFGYAPPWLKSFVASSLSLVTNKDRPFEATKILPQLYLGTKPKSIEHLQWLREKGK